MADAYRGLFVNLDGVVADIKASVPEAANILEVGCGEGAICQRLAMAYPTASITGIDISPQVGRLFAGDRSRVRFLTATIADYAQTSAESHDLVIVADVLHHVPWSMHDEFLSEVVRTMRPGGWLVLKDWERRRNLIHAAGYLSDRYLTGDRIRYGTLSELRQIAERTCGQESVKKVTRYRPWPNNVALFLTPTPVPR